MASCSAFTNASAKLIRPPRGDTALHPMDRASLLDLAHSAAAMHRASNTTSTRHSASDCRASEAASGSDRPLLTCGIAREQSRRAPRNRSETEIRRSIAVTIGEVLSQVSGLSTDDTAATAGTSSHDQRTAPPSKQ